LLFRDATAAFMVLEDARRRLLVRLFGIAREDQLIITLICSASRLTPSARRRRRSPEPRDPPSPAL